MNRATRYFGLLLTATLFMGRVSAEDLPLPDPDGLDLPLDSSSSSEASNYDGIPLPDAELPSPSNEAEQEPSRLVSPPQTLNSPDADGAVAPLDSHLTDESGMGEGEYNGPLDGEYMEGDGEFHAYDWDGEPAPIESSGTWLNRGVWYTEFDAVVLQRIWARGDMFVAADDQNVTIPPNPSVPATIFPSVGLFLNTNRTMYLPSAHPGGDAGVRGTLGRFLFRDNHNRDHTMEFTAWSAGNWVADQKVTSAAPNGLFVSFALVGENDFFNGSSLQHMIYDSQLNSFEMNYRLKKRLGRDQMVMDPNGNWRRESSNGFNRNYLAGFRYLKIDETLTWTAEDILVNGANGKYVIDTKNDLFGFQMGEGIDYESGRWSAGVSAKMGLFWNNADAHQQLLLTANPEDDFDRKNAEAELSFLGEAELIARWHITPNASLRVGAEFLVLDSLALAPRQISLVGGTNDVETGGNPWYIGGFLGYECYW
ncbi:MAG: BBP7 family outer membrane beta-barrel protein [Pirellulales bacterium]